ncbi:MAG: AAA-like domain-containing protein [Cyanobacteria bacterium P01_D01_bin.105]
MTLPTPSPYRHLGGSLPLEDQTYVVREGDQQLYQALRQGEFCYVLNSRQMGKSSLRVRTMQRLQAEGITCGVVDLSAMGTESTQSAWYKGLAYRIMRNFRAVRSPDGSAIDWRGWWKAHDFLSPVQQLGSLIEECLLPTIKGDIVIFIDEIDSVLSLDFSTDDFFSWIRSCYNSRADNVAYRRLAFCLLGVASPSDLIADKQRTPFNIGQAIALNGFKFAQAKDSLQSGLAQANIPNPENVLREILTWTGGQPFLTQKLCQLATTHWSDAGAESDTESSSSIDAIVKACILTNWESQDEPEHLRTIRDRFYAHPERTNRLLGLYQQILKEGGIKSDDSLEQQELRLTGAVAKRGNQLKIFNPTYASVFDNDWVSQALTNIRPYAQSFDSWIASDKTDSASLLTGISLDAAKAWASGKSLSDQDYAYLAACQEAEQDRVEAALAIEAQAKAVLAEANRKANRRIKQGVGILGLAATLLTGSLLFSAQTVQSARVEAADARESAQQSRVEAQESRSTAEAERENARQARQAVTAANRETKAANETAQLAKVEAEQALNETQAALKEAVAAEQVAQQAQSAAVAARQDTQRARAETAEATAQRQQAEQQVEQAQAKLAQANQDIAIARTERNELSVGTRLERSALALVRQSTTFKLDDLVEAVSLGNALQPFLSDGRSVLDYPATGPIFALQTLLTQMPEQAILSYGQDISLEEVANVWFSEDARFYATRFSYDGFRRTYLQYWNDKGQPLGELIELDTYSFDRDAPLPSYLDLSGDRIFDNGTDLSTISFLPVSDIDDIDLVDLPGQESSQLAWPLLNDDGSDISQAFGLLQKRNRFAAVQQNAKTQLSTFQLLTMSGNIIHEHTVEDVSIKLFFQPFGNHVVTLECKLAEPDNCIGNVWNAEGRIVNQIDVLENHLRWTPDGQYLATWNDSELRLTSLEQGSTQTYQTNGRLRSLQSGNSLYFWVRQGPGLTLWDAAQQEPIANVYPLGMNAQVLEAWYNEQTQTIFAVSDHVELGATLYSQPLAKPEEGDEYMETALQYERGANWTFHPDGKGVVVSKFNGELQLWNLDGELLASFVGHEGVVDSVQFSPEGNQILTYSQAEKRAMLWDIQGRAIAQYKSNTLPAIDANWSNIMTLNQRPELHPNLPTTQLKLWSIDRLDTLLEKACTRLQPYLDQDSLEESDRTICH